MQDTYHERKKYEGFGGRPPVGGRPGARAPGPPLNPALEGGLSEEDRLLSEQLV